jgi:hypothetical protein
MPMTRKASVSRIAAERCGVHAASMDFFSMAGTP